MELNIDFDWMIFYTVSISTSASFIQMHCLGIMTAVQQWKNEWYIFSFIWQCHWSPPMAQSLDQFYFVYILMICPWLARSVPFRWHRYYYPNWNTLLQSLLLYWTRYQDCFTHWTASTHCKTFNRDPFVLIITYNINNPKPRNYNLLTFDSLHV